MASPHIIFTPSGKAPGEDKYWERPSRPTNEGSLIKSQLSQPRPPLSSSVASPPCEPPRGDPNQTQDKGSLHQRNQLPESSWALIDPEPDELNEVDIVHEPSRVDRDVTICVYLPIEEDPENHITEFIHLQHLGRFKDAKEYFKANLEHLSHANRHIVTRYVNMLVECGDFKSFLDCMEMDFEVPPGTYTLNNDFEIATYHRLLGILSQSSIGKMETKPLAICSMALATIDPRAMDMAMTRQPIPKHVKVSPVPVEKISMLCLCLRVLGYLDGRCVNDLDKMEVQKGINLAATLLDWRTLYLDMLARKQIWHLRDVFTAAFSVFSWSFISLQFFGTELVGQSLEVMFDDWKPPDYDEDLTMGLLDLVTSLLFQTSSSHENQALLASYAQPLAMEVQKNSPEHMRSRPFIRWLLVKHLVSTAGSDTSDTNHRPASKIASLRGALLKQPIGAHLPVFVPLSLDNKPDWDCFVFPTSPSNRAATEMALQIAKHTGDFQLQSTCLKLLILQSHHPRQFMDALANLQLNIQGDKEGFLETCLCKYLVVTSTQEMKHLLRDLQALDEEENLGAHNNEWANPHLRWAKGVIERALIFSAAGLDVGYEELWETRKRSHVNQRSDSKEERKTSRGARERTRSDTKERIPKSRHKPEAGDQPERQKREQERWNADADTLIPGPENNLKQLEGPGTQPLSEAPRARKSGIVEDGDDSDAKHEDHPS